MKKRIFILVMMFLPLILGLAGPMGKVWAYRVGELEVKLNGGVSETYDDNIQYSSIDQKSDFITRPNVGFTATYASKTATVNAKGNVYQDFFAKNNKLNHNWQNFSIDGAAELSKLDRISASDTFSHTYEPRSLEDQFGRTNGRFSSYRNRVNLGYARDVSEHFGVSLRYSNEYNSYSRADIARSYLNTAGIEGAYSPSSDMSFFASYDYRILNFTPGNNARANTLSGGLRKYLTKQLYFDGRGGADFLNSYSGADSIGPFVDISLTDDIDARTRASLSFNRRYSTISYAQQLFNQWRISGTLVHQFFKKLGSSVSVFYGRGEYVGAGVVNKLVGSNVGLNYDINDKWKASASYSFSKETASLSFGNGYTRNAVTLGLSAEF